MSFPELTRTEAKRRSAFRCCVCHKPFVEVHHLVPRAEGGGDLIDNAAPLCASCHDLYGGNPEKRKSLRQMRDYWWELVSERKKSFVDQADATHDLDFLNESVDSTSVLRTQSVAIYHVVFDSESFDTKGIAPRTVLLITTRLSFSRTFCWSSLCRTSLSYVCHSFTFTTQSSSTTTCPHP